MPGRSFLSLVFSLGRAMLLAGLLAAVVTAGWPATAGSPNGADGGSAAPGSAATSAEARAALAPLLETLVFRYGRTVDDGDVRRAADMLGIGVGSVVDRSDLRRVHDGLQRAVARRYPVLATAGKIALTAPSHAVELAGFHQSGHRGSRRLAPSSSVGWRLLPSRARGTPRASAADVVMRPNRAIRAPVTGTVVRAGTYRLYCRYTDGYVVIEPDARPGWEVKVLHMDPPVVAPGDRVEARRTVISGGAHTLPFRSQVDRYTRPRNWPHVHIEIVDPSVPDDGTSSC